MPDEPRDLTVAFVTHAHYIDAFSQLAGFGLPNGWESGLTSIRTQVDGFMGRAVPARTDWVGDIAQVERSLRSAWGTEVLLLQQLNVVREVEELARVVATWAVVQTYYTGYHSTQALIVAKGLVRPTDHQKTQSLFVNEWAGRSGTADPWTMTYSHVGHGNCAKAIDDSVSNLAFATPLTVHSLAAKALKTTWDGYLVERLSNAREQKLRAARKAFDVEQQARRDGGRKLAAEPTWYRMGRKNLTEDERAAVASKTQRIGLLHYLFRLRIKANYVASDTFVEGPETDWDGVRFVTDLAYLAAALATAHECRVAHIVGRERIEGLRDRWCAGPGRVFPDSGPSADHRRTA
jgi:hypothetical protein